MSAHLFSTTKFKTNLVFIQQNNSKNIFMSFTLGRSLSRSLHLSRSFIMNRIIIIVWRILTRMKWKTYRPMRDLLLADFLRNKLGCQKKNSIENQMSHESRKHRMFNENKHKHRNEIDKPINCSICPGEMMRDTFFAFTSILPFRVEIKILIWIFHLIDELTAEYEIRDSRNPICSTLIGDRIKSLAFQTFWIDFKINQQAADKMHLHTYCNSITLLAHTIAIGALYFKRTKVRWSGRERDVKEPVKQRGHELNATAHIMNINDNCID